ncbi:MAG: hypothetical protein Q9220_006244 [cf. Caloplaca sp. 1 TL-2023]
MAHPQDLRILCFGASITAGFYALGLKHHPYAIRLKDRLQTALPSRNITVDVDALSGDRILAGQYAPRLGPYFDGHTSKRYHWVVFQGGGNDLGAGSDPSAIFEALKNLWKIALDGGASVMALTVTETADQSKRTRQKYDSLNDIIRSHHEDKCFVADVYQVVPYPSMDVELRRKIFDDGLHFKPAGYDMIGDAIADRFIEILEMLTARL